MLNIRSGVVATVARMGPRAVRRVLRPVLEVLMAPAVAAAALVLRTVRQAGIVRFPLTRRLLVRLGVIPVVDHYYDPFVDVRRLARPLSADRPVPFAMGDDRQLELLRSFAWQDELANLPFDYANGSYGPGDAESLYCMIRHFKPRRIIEIGSGHSTRVAILAVARNRAEQPGYACEHVCVEPYEHPWLESAPVTVLRSRVEALGVGAFAGLDAGDILFIDSSHVIRPQGDVLFEYLELVPSVRPGVLVHLHDIFTPRDYPEKFLEEGMVLWNEMYLAEAFLAGNASFRPLLALNYLVHHHPEAAARAFPVLGKSITVAEPGAFWIERVR